MAFEAGGKPSTWFPPGELVELSEEKMCFYFRMYVFFDFNFIFLDFDVFAENQMSNFRKLFFTHMSLLFFFEIAESMNIMI